MNPEDLFIIEAEDVTVSFCIFVFIACVFAAAILFPRINIASPLAKPEDPIVPELSMVRARNPFIVQILHPDSASIKDGIKLLVRPSVCCELHALWVVDCSSLQQVLQDNVMQLLQDAARSLQGHVLHHDHPVNLDAETETQLHLTLPDEVTESQIRASMGPPPRSKYPLCVVIQSLEGECPVDSGPQIVGTVFIFHLPDETFHDRCRLISQLIISDTGQICDLQKLYMASEENNTTQDSIDPATDSRLSEDSSELGATENIHPNAEQTNEDFHEDNLDTSDPVTDGCVVCQSGSIDVALLPCRHTCVCTSCFPLLNKCPMCRSCIESFFPLDRGTEAERCRGQYTRDEEEEDDWAAKFNNSCERFTRWLGLEY